MSKKLDDKVTVAGQITVHDIPAIAAQGFKAVMCNRPDGEQSGQPLWQELEAAIVAAGMSAHFVPLAGRNLDPSAVQGFAQVVDQADGPVFAFCRTGTRCEILWNAARSVAG